MQLSEGIEGLKQAPKGSVLSVGNFDGIHLGHVSLLEKAKSLRAQSGGGIVIVTFEPHPLTVLRPEIAPPRLTPPDEKRERLESAGVDWYVVLPPSREVLGLTAEAFWSIIRDEVRPKHMIEGETFMFGKGRGGNIHRLKEWAAASDVQLHVLPQVTAALLDLTVVPVNSSLIRWLLTCGRVRDAAICLGRAYALRGNVIKGHTRGRAIGVPTANLDCNDQLIPSDGVYVGRCEASGLTYPAAVSIGSVPTFDGAQRQVEAHLVGFDGDLYGHSLGVELLDWIRDQRKFKDVEALKSQLSRDIGRTLVMQKLEPSRAVARVG